MGLMMLAVCNCEEDPTLHDIGAVTYFFTSAIWCLVCSFKELSVSNTYMSSWFNHNVVELILNYPYNYTVYCKILINASVKSLPVKKSS